MLYIVLWSCAVASCFANPMSHANVACGYHSCQETDPDLLNVHIVPHTHDDVGWLKTVEQYYYGSRNEIQKAGVQYILDSVVKELWEDPKRRFMYVETAFFWKWWNRQNKATQQKVHILVSGGRLQFVGGAWSMNDEADTHYQSTIDQFTWGLRKLNDTFGRCGTPRVGWQIDPFGHSREFASLLAAMGYDGLFLGRIDYQDKQNRLRKKTMEMLWRGDDDLGGWSDIFTGVLYNTYSPPPGFCFDILCSDEPIIDDVNSPIYNVDAKVDQFLGHIKAWSKNYRTNNTLITMGGDFTYQDATMWYTNLDKIIKYTNLKAARSGLKIKLFYSTPDCYLNAVKEANPTLPTKQDDFFPYASDPNSYWTGYFTSRPTVKYFEREGNAVLQMAKQLQVLAGLEEHNTFIIDELRSAMGVMQHHDAITGTEKQHVAFDYERMLTQAIDDAILVPRQAFDKFMQTETSKPYQLSFDRCHLNESSCHVSESNGKFVVTLYNPLAWRIEATPVRIPVVDGNYEVFAPNEDHVESQMMKIPQEVLNIPTRKSNATHELVFLALNIKPLGYKNFYVKKKTRRVTRDVHNKRRIDFYENVNDYFQRAKKVKSMQPSDVSERKTKINRVNAAKYADVKIEDNFGKVYVNQALSERGESVDETKDDKVDLVDVVKDDKKQPDTIELEELEKLMKDSGSASSSRLNTNGQRLYHLTDSYRKLARAPVDKERRKYETKDIEELETLMRESHTELPPPPPPPDVSSPYSSPLPPSPPPPPVGPLLAAPPHGLALTAEESRMLGDDPRVVQIYPTQTEEDVVLVEIDKRATSNAINLTLQTPDETPVNVLIDMAYYQATKGNNSQSRFRASGAYIFRPDSNSPVNLTRQCETTTGPVVTETRCVYAPYASLVIRKYNHKSLANIAEVEWLAGPIPVTDGIGKEIILSYRTDIQNNGEFYTDSNGRQMLKRKLDKRPQWNLTLSEPVSGNYYPVTNEIFIQDISKRFVVITDRAQGGSSLEEGNIELMVHRRLLHDDAFGVDEALNEMANEQGLVARGKHWITVDSTKDNSVIQEYVLETHLRPQIFVSEARSLDFDHWIEMKNCYGAIRAIPEGLHLLTLEPWAEGKLLIRIENYLERSSFYKSEREIDLAHVFTTLSLISIKETTLAANRWLDETEKWEWDREDFVNSFNEDYGAGSRKVTEDLPARSDITAFKVKLDAKQIRTFIVEYEMRV